MTLLDGRVLEGRFAEIANIAISPFANNGGAADVKHILMCDDDLTRTFVPRRMVDPKLVDASAPPRFEHFLINQDLAANGAPVAALGAIIQVDPWDSWGRRIFSMAVKGTAIHVIQGITEITPNWCKVESVRQKGVTYLWDMRIATSSIPRGLLDAILLRQIDPKNPDHRLKLVRFYMQAERFQDAADELQQVIKDFPNLLGLDAQVKALRELSAKKRLSEIETRRKAGQHRLADAMLQMFPTTNVSGAVLQAVRDKIEEYTNIQKRGVDVINQLDAEIAKVKDQDIRKQLKPIRDEIQLELFIATLDRMAPFKRLADDPDMTPEQKVAMAISGWLVGPNDAIENLQTALSLLETRKIIRDYLTEPQKFKRDQLLEPMASQQAASPKYVSELLSHMKPPIDTPPQESPGFYKLEIKVGLPNEPDATYFVQLPPEYDPYIKYPTIVTLHAEGSTPELQIDWWAGVSPDAEKRAAPRADSDKPDSKDAGKEIPVKDDGKAAKNPTERPTVDAGGGVSLSSMRRGQATRQGYIVIAPAWTKPHQVQYEFSAREHAIVLGALRDACKRFSIDTDRVYLSGHSIGGDAAWDIALAHPDLWAGVIPITATMGKFIERYWQNAAKLPMYFVSGELDGGKTVINAPQFEQYYLQPGFDMTLVEYQGRGHEHFSDEILRIFDWMKRKQRDFFPKKFDAVTMRTWDNYFWCVELSDMPPGQMVDPAAWPPPRGTQSMRLTAKQVAAPANGVNVDMHSAKLTVWLSPEYVNFALPIEVKINGNRVSTPKGMIKPRIPLMLEDVRTRGDRQHPFWAKVEQ